MRTHIAGVDPAMIFSELTFVDKGFVRVIGYIDTGVSSGTHSLGQVKLIEQTHP